MGPLPEIEAVDGTDGMLPEVADTPAVEQPVAEPAVQAGRVAAMDDTVAAVGPNTAASAAPTEGFGARAAPEACIHPGAPPAASNSTRDDAQEGAQGTVLSAGTAVADAEAAAMVDALAQQTSTLAARGAALLRSDRLAATLATLRAPAPQEPLAGDALTAFGANGWAETGADDIVVTAMLTMLQTACASLHDEVRREDARAAVEHMAHAVKSADDRAADVAQAVAAALQQRMNALLSVGHSVALSACAGGAHVAVAAPASDAATSFRVRASPPGLLLPHTADTSLSISHRCALTTSDNDQ